MKKILLLALVLGVSACGDGKESPVAPSSAITTDGSSTASSTESPDSVSVPLHILNPVEFPMTPGIVTLPPRNEPNTFFLELQALYRDVLRASPTGTFVDSEGQNVWLTEYFRFYLNGCSHTDATTRTLEEVRSGIPQPLCGGENLAFPPRDVVFDFQNRLEATYADVLRRPQTLSFLNSEGASVWLAQYLRFRITGSCDHATAQNKVFTEIRGGGVQPDCTPPTPKSPIDLSKVRWLHTDVSGWDESSEITNVSIGGNGVCIEHTKSGRWRPVDGAEGNPWVFANIGGVWYAATYEYLKPGQICKSAATTRDIGPLTKSPPLNSWRPRSGEEVGFMVSTNARFQTVTNIRERSNVVIKRWP